MVALATGEVKPKGIDLNFLEIHHPRDIFDRQGANQEFDACELSTSEYITQYCAGNREHIAIPVFPSRAFRHGFIAVNSDKVKTPKDLEGKKIGVQLYTMTAAVWQRGESALTRTLSFAPLLGLADTTSETLRRSLLVSETPHPLTLLPFCL
jgi:4,5-dihydroxyphthalate decarboxylase